MSAAVLDQPPSPSPATTASDQPPSPSPATTASDLPPSPSPATPALDRPPSPSPATPASDSVSAVTATLCQPATPVSDQLPSPLPDIQRFRADSISSVRGINDHQPSSDFALLCRKIDMLSDRIERKLDSQHTQINRRLDVLCRRQLSLETDMRELKDMHDRRAVETVTTHTLTTQQQDNDIDQTDMCTSDLYEGIAPAYQIPLETLRLYEAAASSRGNFVTKLVEVLFPELFGTSNFYKNYSYNGGGRHMKLELDTARKIAIRRYSIYFYPDLKKQESYQKHVIDAVNERLRRRTYTERKEQEERKQRQTATTTEPTPTQTDLHLSQIEDVFPENLLDYTIL